MKSLFLNKKGNSIPSASLFRLVVSQLLPYLSFRVRQFFGVKKRVVYPMVTGYGADATGRNRKVLLTYVLTPFLGGDKCHCASGHQNQWQTLEIAEIFNEAGYVVDIVDYRDIEFSLTSKYDVVFGVHPAFCRALGQVGEDSVKIYYALEMPWQFQNAAIEKRYEELKHRRGVHLRPGRIIVPHDSWTMADYIIYMGTDFTVQTYAKYGGYPSKFYNVPNTTWAVDSKVLASKDFGRARKNFLFLGSSDLVLRGLDRVLEAFTELRDCQLYICAPLKEVRFCMEYRKELFGCSNIHAVGWINVKSESFRRIVERCAFLIYPSGSEGCAGSVVTGMGNGLIPIVSRMCTVQTDDFGFTLADCEIETIRETVRRVSELPVVECREMARKTLKVAKNRFARELFSQRMSEVLGHILGKHR